MKTKILEINRRVLAVVARLAPKIIGAMLVVGLVAAVLTFNVYRKKVSTPISVREFAATSVRITNMKKTSGGSGAVLRSSADGTDILTNEHVCRLIEKGGLVEHQGKDYLAQAYKTYYYHDLCLLKVRENLNTNTQLAAQNPDVYDRAFISGHPALLPHVLTSGNFSGRDIVQVMVGLKKCEKADIEKRPLECFFLGGVPIIRTFETQLVTGTILPGSSGSAVFNESGEIAGVVFAGRSREMSYAFIVPYAYVKHFIDTEWAYEFTTIDYSTQASNNATEEVKSICRGSAAEKIPACKNATEILIWEY